MKTAFTTLSKSDKNISTVTLQIFYVSYGGDGIAQRCKNLNPEASAE